MPMPHKQIMADLAALPTSIELEIVAPERQVVQQSVVAVSVPGENGYLGILPGHAPLLSVLKSGELSFTQDGRTYYVAVNWGFVEVLPDRVVILAQTAERADEIDLSRAQRAKRRAEDRLRKVGDPEIDMKRAEVALERALTRLQVAERAGRQ